MIDAKQDVHEVLRHSRCSPSIPNFDRGAVGLSGRRRSSLTEAISRRAYRARWVQI